MSEPLARLRGTPAIALGSMMFAGMATLARSVAGRVQPGELVFIRMAVGLVAVIAYYAVTGRRPRTTRPYLLAARGLFGGVAVVLYFFAIDLMPVGPATLLNNTAPVFAAVFAALFLREPLSRRVGVALTLSMVGAAIVILGTAPAGQRLHLGLGAIAGLLSGVVSGAALATLRALRTGSDPVTVLLSFCLIGALVSLPLATATFQPLTPSLWISTVGVGLFSIAGQLLLTYGLAHVPTASGSATTLLTTVFSWTLGAVFLHEGLNGVSALGAALCIGGVVLASRDALAGRIDRPGETSS